MVLRGSEWLCQVGPKWSVRVNLTDGVYTFLHLARKGLRRGEEGDGEVKGRGMGLVDGRTGRQERGEMVKGEEGE